MASPDPTYADGLALVDQPLQLDTLSRTAHVTYALTNTGAFDAEEIAGIAFNLFATTLGVVLSDQVMIGRCTVKLGDGTTTPSVGVSAATPQPGETDTGTLPSPNIACLLKKITSLAGRANRGRMYLPWAFGEAGISDTGLLTGDQVDLVQAAATDFIDQLATGDIPMVICNRTIDDNPTPPPATYISAYETGPVVTQFQLEAYAATQRRRMPRSS